MDVIGKPITIYVDAQVLNNLDSLSKKHSISRSAVIRLIVNDFFLKQESKP